MGETAKGDRKYSYYSIVGGKMLREVKEPSDLSRTRTNQNGREVHEIEVGSVMGYIHTIKAENEKLTDGKDIGQQLKIVLKDKEGYYEIKVPLSSGYASDFLNRFNNIALDKIVEIKSFEIQDKENEKKKKYCLIPYQGDWEMPKDKILSAFSKENPGAPMAIKENTGTKKEPVWKWNFTNVIAWYAEFVENTVKPAIEAKKDTIAMLAEQD